MGKEWMMLLQQQNQMVKVMKTNQVTEQFGLVLTEQDASLILEEQKSVLSEQRRVEYIL